MDAQQSLKILRESCPTLSAKTCYAKPTTSGPVLSIYGVVGAAEIDHIERKASLVLPRTRDTRVILKFYRAEVLHQVSNGATRREAEELLYEVLIR